MLNGLDLFSGIGGLTLALSDWVRPVAYCEIDRYAQAVLLSRMQEGKIPLAPIFDDVRMLSAKNFDRRISIDIISAGFPCQDLSTAGRKAGIKGERSGLFYQVTRLVEECQPQLVFLENIAQGINQYEEAIAEEFARIGYKARAIKVSAFQVGANHERLRWFCLAYSDSTELRHTDRRWNGQSGQGQEEYFSSAWWAREPTVSGVADGIPNRLDRLKCLGNAVVPAQARKAFKVLIGDI